MNFFLFKTTCSSSSVNALNMPFADLSIRVLVLFIFIYLNSLELLVPSYKWLYFLVCCFPFYFNFQNYGCSYVVRFLILLLFSSLEIHSFPEARKIFNPLARLKLGFSFSSLHILKFLFIYDVSKDMSWFSSQLLPLQLFIIYGMILPSQYICDITSNMYFIYPRIHL